jgi:hypothetical protein
MRLFIVIRKGSLQDHKNHDPMKHSINNQIGSFLNKIDSFQIGKVHFPNLHQILISE